MKELNKSTTDRNKDNVSLEIIEKSKQTNLDNGFNTIGQKDILVSEIRYRRLFESAKDGILILDAETGMIIDVNPFLIDLLGITKKDFVKKSIWEIGYFKDILENIEKFQELQQKKYVRYEDLPLETADGRIIHVEFVSNVYRENLENVIQCNIRDITQRIEEEESLRKSRMQLSNALDIANLAHWEYDIIKDKFTFNDQFYKLFRTTVEEVGGYEMSSAEYERRFVYPEDMKMVGEATQMAIETINPKYYKQIEHRILYSDGTNGCITVRILIKKDDKGNTIKTYGVIQDISDIKLAEQNLRDNELKFHNYVDNAPHGIFIADEIGNYIDVNPAACKITGYSKNELLSMNIIELVAEESYDKAELQIRSTIEEGFSSGEIAFVKKDKTKGFWSVDAVQLSNNNLLAFVVDITEQKQIKDELIIAKEKAEESDKLKTAFLQNMSHEIRTPLNGIIGFSSLLELDQGSKEERHECIEMIKISGERLVEIVDNVLEISQIHVGQMNIKRESINLNALLLDTLSIFTHKASEKNLSLNYKNQNDNDIAVFTDERKLNQILSNLISNAIKFTTDGKVDYGYEVKDSNIQFFVKDTGVGIPEEFRDKLYDRFTQADLSISRSYEGAGLGLAICKGLVELLGGKIWMESTVNVGTTFFFTLPYKYTEIQKPEDDKNLEKVKKQKQRKILVVEDDITSSIYMTRILRNEGFEVILAENGLEAIQKVKSNSDINLIFMDMRMPVMDGMEATKRIKKIRPNLPIIAQTAYAFSEEKERILAGGCDDYISKPVKIERLLTLIKKYVNI